MKFLIFGLLGFFAVATEAKVEYTQTAKDCLSEINTDEDAMRSILNEDKLFPEDNELAVKFFECIYRSNINDNNEIVVDDKLKDYITQIISRRLEGKTESASAASIANDCLEHCKDRKGDSKGQTAIKVMNCVKERFVEYVNEKH
ncbi:hypothetical protein ILUMI_18866 [Ignelater luminosus]|uniref:Uncharacterized protein n=1 Tax=Ignelater luminosus TaxID=2038154 RepID=A0A8K0G3R0_IGNLU|nr:hypothetical protein ILUMI_18866 [Ignelater luminosus]